MIMVKTKLGKSKIHGIGLFADQNIKKGTITWDYQPWFHITYSKEDLKKMSKPAREQVLWYAFVDKKDDRYILCADDQRFINHSSNPKKINILSISQYRDIALRDIKKGEELLCDYNKFDDTYFKRLKMNPKKLK